MKSKKLETDSCFCLIVPSCQVILTLTTLTINCTDGTLGYCWFLVEDIKLNSTVFHWPEHIETVFELATTRLAVKREDAEDRLRRKVVDFEKKIDAYHKEIELFRKKEVLCYAALKPSNKSIYKSNHLRHFMILGS